MAAVKDLPVEQRARLAARLIDQVGMDAVTPHLPTHAVRAPRPGVAVLACHCGRVLDAADMHRSGTGGAAEGDDPDCLTVRRITCKECSSS